MNVILYKMKNIDRSSSLGKLFSLSCRPILNLIILKKQDSEMYIQRDMIVNNLSKMFSMIIKDYY